MQAIALTAASTQDCSLVLDLVPESDLAGPGVTLRFHGVARLVVHQFDAHTLFFDYLTCEDRGTERRDRKRYQIRDRWGESIEFLCDSFEEVRR